jgi:hypothetical protein
MRFEPIDQVRREAITFIKLIQHNYKVPFEMFENMLCAISTSKGYDFKKLPLRVQWEYIMSVVSITSALGGKSVDASTQAFLEFAKDYGASEYLCKAALLDRVPCFVFRDQGLVQSILESRLHDIPVDSLRLPFNSFAVQLPYSIRLKRLSQGELASGNVLILHAVNAVNTPTDNTQEFFRQSLQQIEQRGIESIALTNKVFHLLLVDTERPDIKITAVQKEQLRVLLGLDEFSVHDTTTVYWPLPVGGLVPDDTTLESELGMIFIKLAAFLTSPSTVINTVNRSRKELKATPKTKQAYRTINVVEFDKTRVDYQYDDNTPAGRKLSVRHAVIGHFKHYTKGALAGRVLWCPPHMRGPDVGDQVQRQYVVEQTAADTQ